MFFWATVAIGTTIAIFNEKRKERKKMRDRPIFSRKSLNIPRRKSFGAIPRAFSDRALNELKRSKSSHLVKSRKSEILSSRELYFDESSHSIFTMATAPLQTDDSEDESISSDPVYDEDGIIWC